MIWGYTNVQTQQRRAPPASAAGRDGHDLIALAQKLARDAERHALLSASLASQADRLMNAGLMQLERPAVDRN